MQRKVDKSIILKPGNHFKIRHTLITSVEFPQSPAMLLRRKINAIYVEKCHHCIAWMYASVLCVLYFSAFNVPPLIATMVYNVLKTETIHKTAVCWQLDRGLLTATLFCWHLTSVSWDLCVHIYVSDNYFHIHMCERANLWSGIWILCTQ